MKQRLDTLLVELEYFDTREKAKREILAGNVIINDKVEIKAGTQFKKENIKSIRIKDRLKYVSRGGLKLEGAIKYFDISFKNKYVLDIGASTGGFTDCAIKNGAKKVYALDVGTNQLDYSLRVNPNVISIEKTHINKLKDEQIQDLIDIVVIDVSFISATKIIDEIRRLNIFNKDFLIVLLIKPQFELQKEKIGKNGIVVNEEYRNEAISKICNYVKEDFEIIGITQSPITGGYGNIEYLAYLKRR